ncbi:MAG: nickel pincer cofactor biosynthesis protein LarC [Actinomycetota bacterium]
MTRVAYLDPIGGMAGDMLLAALLDAGAPLDALDETIGALGLAARIDVRRVERSGVVATHVDVVTSKRTHERPARELRELVGSASLAEPIRLQALEALERLIAAEASIHGVEPGDVILHELGGDDTLVDLCGVFALLHALGVQRVASAPLPMGGGLVTTDHGPLPMPAPATLVLLQGVAVIGVATPGELVTPTGAAIVATVATSFGPMPSMTPSATGYGAGTRTHPDRPNLVRVVLGDVAEDGARRGEVVVLQANVDDMIPELVPDALDACLAAGALDAWTEPIAMKKGRPGLLVSVLARPHDERRLAETLLQHSTSLGVRVQSHARYELDRAIREVQVEGRTVRVKIGLLDGRVVNVAPEHDDCAQVAAASGRPVKQIWAEALAAATTTLHMTEDADDPAG